jgi:soluble lytic murein transglycosylase
MARNSISSMAAACFCDTAFDSLAEIPSFSYSVPVPSLSLHPASLCKSVREHFSEFTFPAVLLTAVLSALGSVPQDLSASESVAEPQRQAFMEAWQSARNGDRAKFESALEDLDGYLLHPYLQYEDLRHRRSRVDDEEMQTFIEAHRNWAFTSGLEKSWLRALGKRGRWESVLEYGVGSKDTEVRCHVAHARIRAGQLEGLVQEAQALWAVGKSQPDACDPVFSWLIAQDGVSTGLAWERVRLAMAARERNLARYASRFMDDGERVWAERWYEQDRGGYRRLQQAGKWPDKQKAWEIVDFGLRRLARNDPDRAWAIFSVLDERFDFPANTRGGLLAQLALWSAVGRADETAERMAAVPDDFRDDQVLEWWVRYQLLTSDWEAVPGTIAQMSPKIKDDSRWRYWDARARLEAGQAEEGRRLMQPLAEEANFYGFLAADLLELPYSICPEKPGITAEAIDRMSRQDGFDRALELRQVALSNWARSEWGRATRGLDNEGLRTAAALAEREQWPDMVIFALGNSGDLRWYEWRFPLDYEPLIAPRAKASDLDPSWVMGLMRSESALAEDAISHAGARGLMQVTPHTATQLARRHSIPYSGRAQLLDPETNVTFGTTFLRELLDRFGQNPVLATGAYNAGPGAVDRWLADGYTGDPVVWIDTLPYFETRDYIPRVLAFSTLYEWRFGGPVRRISERMPPIGAVTATASVASAEVVCSAGE